MYLIGAAAGADRPSGLQLYACAMVVASLVAFMLGTTKNHFIYNTSWWYLGRVRDGVSIGVGVKVRVKGYVSGSCDVRVYACVCFFVSRVYMAGIYVSS